MAELTQQQLAEFNGQTGFIIKLKNNAPQTYMSYDGKLFLYGSRYPANKPSQSGVNLSQHGDKPICHYFYDEGTCGDVKGSLRYRILLEQTGTSLYLYVGYKNHADGNHGYYVSLKEESSDSELRNAAHYADEDGSVDYPFLRTWMAHVDYENYTNSVSVQQINVTFSRIDPNVRGQRKAKN